MTSLNLAITIVVTTLASGSLSAQTALKAQQEQSHAFIEPMDLMNPHGETESCAGDRPTISGHMVSLNLKIKYSDHTIYNPNTGQNDHVRLRTYNDCLVGPTVRLTPGDRFLLNVENDLPTPDPSCPSTITDHNDPNCFNSGNIHTHGLHVSPTGNSDNVLLSIPPGTTFPYQYDLLTDHPAGTFWYHSHRHGSTALSVSSGMVGALIIKGDRRIQDKAKNGIADIDTLLHDRHHHALTDRVMMFEQIAYGCFANGDTSGFPEQDSSTGAWTCGPKDVGVVENYKTQFGFETVPGSSPPIRGSVWPTSGRFTELNGKIMPTLRLRAGQIERWRLIHGGVRDTINLQIVKAKPTAAVTTAGDLALPSSFTDARQLVSQTCDTTQVIKQYEIALDGLTRREIHAKDLNVLQPGYRSDILMVFPNRGLYCVLDTEKTPGATIIGTGRGLHSNDNNLLAIVNAQQGATVTGDPVTYIENQLIAANPDLPQAIKQELQQGDIHEYSPHADLNTAQIQGRPFVDFNFVLFTTATIPPGPTPPAPTNAVLLGQAAIADSAANAHSLVVDTPATIPTLPNVSTYDPGIVNYTGQLGKTDEWTVTSTTATHVYHIHVNPFEIIDIKNNGTSIIDGSGNCSDGADPQYCDLFDKTQNKFGVFRDTVFVKQNYQIVLRTTYDRYVGEYVMHCHILDHEDQGMMQNIFICPPGGPCPVINQPSSIISHLH